MKYNSTVAMKTKLNAESNVMNTVELKLYGVQAYNVSYGEEYNVIVRAERQYNGRYYFITREGYQIAWSSLDKEKVEHICADMLDQVESDEHYIVEHMNKLRNNGSCLIRAEVMNDIYDLADEFELSLSIKETGADEIGRTYYHVELINGSELFAGETAEPEDEVEQTESQEAEQEPEQAQTKLYLYAYQNGEQKSRRESTMQEFTQMAELFADVMQNIMHYSVDYLPGADRITWRDTAGNVTDIMVR